ncbi:MAG: aminotransferase class I/II-fold pyridoxal phosphate-dependent enzyme, partial [Thermoplasmata archaeon]
VYVPLRAGFSLDADALRSAVTARTKMLILVSPANPTGRVLRREEIRAALEVARDRHLTVVSDETYEALVYEGRHVSPASIADGKVPVITVGSFSKIYAMTGWRVGFAIAPPKVVSRLVKVMEHTLTCVPPFIQKASVWALANAGSDEERIRGVFRERRDHLLRRIARVDGLTTVAPEGAFYIFPRYDLRLSSVQFCAELLRDQSVAVVPGVAFGPHGEGHIRISYSSPVSVLDEGVDRLERFLRHHHSASP